jgi:hypothetical protein
MIVLVAEFTLNVVVECIDLRHWYQNIIIYYLKSVCYIFTNLFTSTSFSNHYIQTDAFSSFLKISLADVLFAQQIYGC